MKKFISLFLILTLIFCFAACGGNENNDSNYQNNDTTKNSSLNNEVVLDIDFVIPTEDSFRVENDGDGVKIVDCSATESNIEIPEKINGKIVKSIGSGAFNNAEITAIKFADTIETVEDEAFINSYELETVVINSNLKVIPSCCFQNSMLSTVVIPEGVVKLEDNAFFGCNNLKSVTIPNSVESIGPTAFAYCENLEEVKVLSNVTELLDGVFYCSDKVSLLVESGSQAEAYAKEKNIEYKIY